MPHYYFEYQMFPYRYGNSYMTYPDDDDPPFDTAYARKSKPLGLRSGMFPDGSMELL